MNSSKYNLYLSVWSKYLPVLRILIKKSAASDQVFTFNRIDFERTTGIRKAGYKFTVDFLKGRPDGLYSGNEMVQTFISALQTDEVIGGYIATNNYTFIFTTKYQLSIKNTGTHKQEVLPELEEENAAG